MYSYPNASLESIRRQSVSHVTQHDEVQTPEISCRKVSPTSLRRFVIISSAEAVPARQQSSDIIAVVAVAEGVHVETTLHLHPERVNVVSPKAHAGHRETQQQPQRGEWRVSGQSASVMQ